MTLSMPLSRRGQPLLRWRMKVMSDVTIDRINPYMFKTDETKNYQKKRQVAFRSMIGAYLFQLISLAALGLAWFGSSDPNAKWVMIAFNVIVLGLCAWGTWFYFKRAKFGYTILEGKVRVEFESAKYFVPKRLMAKFLGGIVDDFRPHMPEPFDEIFKVTMQVLDERPKDPADRMDPNLVVGITYHQFKTSKVYGPYALNDGGLGYEFRLQLCELALPGSSEGEKLAWMKEQGLYS